MGGQGGFGNWSQPWIDKCEVKDRETLKMHRQNVNYALTA